MFKHILLLLSSFAALASVGQCDQAQSSVHKRIPTPDNTCGGTVNGYTCNKNKAGGGPCCSSNGQCGSGPEFCGAGCQWAFSSPGCSFSSQNKCGPSNGLTCKPDSVDGGPCCSAAGYCGISKAYCGSGCNPAYGSCFGDSEPVIKSGNTYQVPGVGTFSTFKNYTFNGDSLPPGLHVSLGLVGSRPLTHRFTRDNVAVRDGFLELLVPGGQTKQPIACGEIYTNEASIFYGSVRTYAIFSDVPGTVHGLFFYRSDKQEIDIEYLTDPTSGSNPGNGKSNLQYTNQATAKGKRPTTKVGPAPADAASVIHEYRIDWVEGKTLFYLDGVLQRTITTNVPTKPGPWLWNNWSSGDKEFTVGPPKRDNVLKIQNIVMYYNVSGNA